MLARHKLPELPSPLSVESAGDEVRISLPEGPACLFVFVPVLALTRRVAAELVGHADEASDHPIFVSYRQGSEEAREALREACMSFAGDDGRVFIRAPGMLVERDLPIAQQLSEWWWPPDARDPSTRNPFAKRSSRVPRWLLLHHHEAITMQGLADSVELDRATVSRVIRALEDGALVRAIPADSGRHHVIQLERPRALLDAWLGHWQRRRIRVRHWNIGASDADDVIRLLTQDLPGFPEGWAIGGLAGAALVRRAVEPANVLVWISEEQLSPLATALQPEPARSAGRGVLSVAVAPDPWTLRLAQSLDGLPVADPAQLWLDCASQGERALEAADAVAESAGWL